MTTFSFQNCLTQLWIWREIKVTKGGMDRWNSINKYYQQTESGKKCVLDRKDTPTVSKKTTILKCSTNKMDSQPSTDHYLDSHFNMWNKTHRCRPSEWHFCTSASKQSGTQSMTCWSKIWCGKEGFLEWTWKCGQAFGVTQRASGVAQSGAGVA